MAEYTYKDVIIDPNDERVEIGAEYYYHDYPKGVLDEANRDGRSGKLNRINSDTELNFRVKSFNIACIIRKKQFIRKYVPFDLLHDTEAREKLAGVCVKDKENEDVFVVTYMSPIKGTIRFGNSSSEFSMDELLKWFTFLDGTPCGKLVEVENNEGE